jgi:hypothetical protein
MPTNDDEFYVPSDDDMDEYAEELWTDPAELEVDLALDDDEDEFDL